MNFGNFGALAIMLLSGLLIPVMAAMNANTGVRVGNPAAAGAILIGIGFLGAALFVVLHSLINGSLGSLFQLDFGAAAHPSYWFAGLAMAFYIVSITFLAPRVGVGTAVFFVLLGQMIASAVIDHFGLFGASVDPLTWRKALGLLLMTAGVFLAKKVG